MYEYCDAQAMLGMRAIRQALQVQSTPMAQLTTQAHICMWRKRYHEGASMNYVPNEKIQEWLDQGLTVRSAAMGRVGRVVEINKYGDVVIDSVKKNLGRCVTTFERGDEVSATLMDGIVVINNADYMMHLYSDDKSRIQ